MPAPLIWALSAGHAGARAQAEGLAAQLAQLSGGTAQHHTVQLPALAKLPPPVIARHFARIDADLSTPPDIAVGCGINGQSAVLALKKKHRTYAIYIQRPSGSAAHFDAIVAPQHDYRGAPPPENLIPIHGAVGNITPDTLATRRPAARQRFAAQQQTQHQQPLIAALIGGDNRAYRIVPATLTQQLTDIAAQTGAKLLITPSRRSGGDLTRRLQEHFGNSHYCWSGEGDNPYTDILAAADGHCVTADSVNMISEASASGRAVYALPLAIRNPRAAQKFTAFHNALIARGNLRHYDGSWTFFSAPPLDDTREAARQLWQRYQTTHPRQPAPAPTPSPA